MWDHFWQFGSVPLLYAAIVCSPLPVAGLIYLRASYMMPSCWANMVFTATATARKSYQENAAEVVFVIDSGGLVRGGGTGGGRLGVGPQQTWPR